MSPRRPAVHPFEPLFCRVWAKLPNKCGALRESRQKPPIEIEFRYSTTPKVGLKKWSNWLINRENVDADSFTTVSYLRPSQRKKGLQTIISRAFDFASQRAAFLSPTYACQFIGISGYWQVLLSKRVTFRACKVIPVTSIGGRLPSHPDRKSGPLQEPIYEKTRWLDKRSPTATHKAQRRSQAWKGSEFTRGKLPALSSPERIFSLN